MQNVKINKINRSFHLIKNHSRFISIKIIIQNIIIYLINTNKMKIKLIKLIIRQAIRLNF